MSPTVGDYVRVDMHDEEAYQGKQGFVIEQTDPRIFHDSEWPMCTPEGTTGLGNVWLYFDEPVKGKHTWQVKIDRLIEAPWVLPSTPEDIEVFLNG